jgi:hypothetical protein
LYFCAERSPTTKYQLLAFDEVVRISGECKRTLA